MRAQTREERTIGDLVSGAVDSFSDLVNVHMSLAKAELARDVSRAGMDMLPLVIGAVLLCTGYLLLCVAAGAGIAAYAGPVAGFAIVGGANLLVGALAMRTTIVRFKRPRHRELAVGAELAQSARDVMPKMDHGSVKRMDVADVY